MLAATIEQDPIVPFPYGRLRFTVHNIANATELFDKRSARIQNGPLFVRLECCEAQLFHIVMTMPNQN